MEYLLKSLGRSRAVHRTSLAMAGSYFSSLQVKQTEEREKSVLGVPDHYL